MLLGIMTTGLGGGSLVSCGSVGGFGLAAGFMDDTFVAALADALPDAWLGAAARPFASGFALAAFLGSVFEADLDGLAGFFMESDAPADRTIALPRVLAQIFSDLRGGDAEL
jgi:hypothetical protein